MLDSKRHADAGSTVHFPVFESVAVEGLALAIAVDDIRPEAGFGAMREKGQLAFLIRLYEEFGCKATLFVPTNWKARWPLDEHLDWLRWLIGQPFFEVACHGHLHAIGPDSPDPGEFRGVAAEVAGSTLRQSLAVFEKVDYRPSGFKPPGWFLEPSAYGVLDRRFSYVAEHVIGSQVARLRDGRLLRFPYLYTIDEMGPWPDEGVVVLQSHIAAEGTTTNAWSEGLYERVRAFVKTGKRLGARFVTLRELATSIRADLEVGEAAPRPSASPAADMRLHGGEIEFFGDEAGVLYNAEGDPCPLRLTPRNAAIAILSRNRRPYLVDLLKSIDESGPEELARVVLLNNCEDDSAEYLGKYFTNWRVVELNDADYPEEPAGLTWLKENMPEILPHPVEKLGPKTGWTAPRSVGWLKNRQVLECRHDFLVSFDDDFVVRPGWWEYYVRFQHELAAHAVINNFGAFVLCRTLPERIGGFDERFLGSHGCEDNDYSARLAEGKVRWVLGFNRDHDWRSAEEGNPRGSMTGSDYFIHRYALKHGGYSAKREEGRRDPVKAAWNARWFDAKWEETTEHTGVFARPPFRGKFLRRKVSVEWKGPLAGR